MTARDGSNARNMPGYEIMLTMPVDASRRSHMNVTVIDIKRMSYECKVDRYTWCKDIREERRSSRLKQEYEYKKSLIIVSCILARLILPHTMEIGVTSLDTDCLATAIPETALVTDTAGVKTPSARVRHVPNRLCSGSGKERRATFIYRCSQGPTTATRPYEIVSPTVLPM